MLMLEGKECPNFMIGDTKTIAFFLGYVDKEGRKRLLKIADDKTNGF